MQTWIVVDWKLENRGRTLVIVVNDVSMKSLQAVGYRMHLSLSKVDFRVVSQKTFITVRHRQLPYRWLL